MLCHTKWVSSVLSNFDRKKYIFKQRNISTSQKGRIWQKLKVTRFIWVFIALGMYDFDYTIPCHPSESLFAEILPTTSIKKTYSTHFQKAALRVSINRIAITWQVCQFLSKRLPNQPALHKPFQSEKLVKWQHLQSIIKWFDNFRQN